MSAPDRLPPDLSIVPIREHAIRADQAAGLFALSKDRFLRTIACRPSFPLPVNRKPLAWKLGEVLDWRDDNRASRAA